MGTTSSFMSITRPSCVPGGAPVLPGARHEKLTPRWPPYPREKAILFSLRIEQALFVAWDIDHGVMTVHQWSPRRGYSHRTRTYP